MCDVFKVAKVFCERRKWRATNLEIQKLLYIAQVFSLGLRDKPLFKNMIEAWRYGPVVRDVYDKFKMYGSMPIQPIMFADMTEHKCTDEDREFVEGIAEATKDLRDWQLVGLTHRDGTAWKKRYNQFTPTSNVITEDDMRDEFEHIWKKQNG